MAWRPSRWLATALLAIGLLGAGSVLACAMPRWLALPLALLSAVQGARLARRHLRAPGHVLVWPMDAAPSVDGVRTGDAQLHWRGPLAFLRYRDAAGRRRRLAWWPDTLDGRQRRELRLAAASAPATPTDASMAP